MSDLRSHLSEWLDCARGGEEVVITERGVPVARLLGVSSAPIIERLVAQGVIGRALKPSRPKAGGRERPVVRRPISEIVSEQRR